MSFTLIGPQSLFKIKATRTLDQEVRDTGSIKFVMQMINSYRISDKVWTTHAAGPITWSDGKQKVVYLKGTYDVM